MAVLGPWAGLVSWWQGSRWCFTWESLLTIPDLKFPQHKTGALSLRVGECPVRSRCYRRWCVPEAPGSPPRLCYEASFSFRMSRCVGLLSWDCFSAETEGIPLCASPLWESEAALRSESHVHLGVWPVQEPSRLLNAHHNPYFMCYVCCFQVFLRDFLFNVLVTCFLLPAEG